MSDTTGWCGAGGQRRARHGGGRVPGALPPHHAAAVGPAPRSGGGGLRPMGSVCGRQPVPHRPAVRRLGRPLLPHAGPDGALSRSRCVAPCRSLALLHALQAAMGHQYDDYNRSLPDVFVGEFAANNGHHKTLQAAVAEAVFMIGFEQNGDKVRSPRRRARHSRETRQCRAVASAVASGEERPRRARGAQCAVLLVRNCAGSREQRQLVPRKRVFSAMDCCCCCCCSLL